MVGPSLDKICHLALWQKVDVATLEVNMDGFGFKSS